jgi:hypothetical protein
MVNRTRKQKKQKGGSIGHLPRNLAPITGDTPKNLIRDFFTQNNNYYVAAHGTILPHSKYTIPDNTYILHLTVSGKLLRGENAQEMEDIVQDFEKENLWKLLTGQEKNSGKVTLFSPGKYEPYKEKVAIYRPGESVSDMILSFSSKGNADTDIVLSGAYRIPVEPYLFERRKKMVLEKMALLTKEKETLAFQKLSEQDKKKSEISIANKFAKDNDPFFQTHRLNLLKDYFTRKLKTDEGEEKRFQLTESALVHDFERFPNPPSGFRLFIVDACRGVCTTLEENAKRVRAESMNLQEYEEGVKERYFEEERLKKEEREKRNRKLFERLLEYEKEELDEKLGNQNKLVREGLKKAFRNQQKIKAATAKVKANVNAMIRNIKQKYGKTMKKEKLNALIDEVLKDKFA